LYSSSQKAYPLNIHVYPAENFTPTLSHYFVKLLEDQGRLLRHYTQNIDTLERKAGIAGDKLVEAHGSFASAHCVGCKKEIPAVG
jgi:NAD-dependent SIR2 family protein deacetylase